LALKTKIWISIETLCKGEFFPQNPLV